MGDTIRLGHMCRQHEIVFDVNRQALKDDLDISGQSFVGAAQAVQAQAYRCVVFAGPTGPEVAPNKCVAALTSQLRVSPLQYTVQVGIQAEDLTDGKLRDGDGFTVTDTRTEFGKSVHSLVKYDLVGKVAESTQLTRETVANIFTGIEPAVFGQFKTNPEHFISEASRIVSEQKASMVIERLAYDEVEERYDVSIFTAAQTGQDFSRASAKLKNHVYDYAVLDSDVERSFVNPTILTIWPMMALDHLQSLSGALPTLRRGLIMIAADHLRGRFPLVIFKMIG